MNLPLHFGLLGTLEAGLIALLVGLLVFFLWERMGRMFEMTHGQVLGWAWLIATVIGAGYDTWNLVYTSVVRLESPLYAKLALARIHDPNELGSRVVMELAGAFAGIALGWYLFSRRSDKNGAAVS